MLFIRDLSGSAPLGRPQRGARAERSAGRGCSAPSTPSGSPSRTRGRNWRGYPASSSPVKTGEGDREAVEGALAPHQLWRGRWNAPQPMRTPMAPSTGKMAPEMNFASSDARNRAA